MAPGVGLESLRFLWDQNRLWAQRGRKTLAASRQVRCLGSQGTRGCSPRGSAARTVPMSPRKVLVPGGRKGPSVRPVPARRLAQLPAGLHRCTPLNSCQTPRPLPQTNSPRADLTATVNISAFLNLWENRELLL